MRKAVKVLFSGIVCLLLLYAISRFIVVRSNIIRSQRELEELRSISETLSRENEAIAYRIIQAEENRQEEDPKLPNTGNP